MPGEACPDYEGTQQPVDLATSDCGQRGARKKAKPQGRNEISLTDESRRTDGIRGGTGHG